MDDFDPGQYPEDAREASNGNGNFRGGGRGRGRGTGRGRGRGGGGFRGSYNRGGGIVTTKLFVGNLPETLSVSLLRREFEAFGKVTECDIVRDYAFVHFDKPEEAVAAQEGMNNKHLCGSDIRVELSHSKVRQKPGMGDQPGCYRCGSESHWSKDCPTAPPGRRRYDDRLLMEDERDHRPARPRDYPPRRPDPYDSYYRERLRDRYLDLPPLYSRPSPYDRLDRYPPPRPYRYADPAPLPAPAARIASSYTDDPYARPPPDYYERRKAATAASPAAPFRDPYARDPLPLARDPYARDPY